MASEGSNDALNAGLKVANTFTPPTVKIGCGLGFLLLMMAIFFFSIGLNSPGVDEAAASGAGGAASGSCMDIENGTALSSKEIGKLLDKISNAKLLRGGEKTIYDEAKEASVNPMWSFAQAQHESHFGQDYVKISTSMYGKGKNMFGMDYTSKYKKEHMATPAWEWGGLSGKHKVAQFKKWEFGLSEHMRLIRRAYWGPGKYAEEAAKKYNLPGPHKFNEMNNNQKALATIHKYAPHEDNNNPDAYTKNVLDSMEGWCKDLGIDPNEKR